MAFRASHVITFYCTLYILSCVTGYFLAVGLSHTNAFVPYLNYLGDQPFESTLFTQMFGLISCVLSLIVQINYVYTASSLEKNQAQIHSLEANLCSVYVGQLSALGLFIIACYQESHARYIHYLGRLMYLGGSIVYFTLLTSISVKENDFRKKRRVIIDALLLIFAVGWLGGFLIASLEFNRPWNERLYWNSCDMGWSFHVISVISEWMIIFLIQAYILTFYPDFQRTMITQTTIIVLSEESEESE